MKRPFKERTLTTLIVIPSAIIVIALGVLQYRWSTSLSQATKVRLADSLQMSLMNWQKDFFRYFSEIGQALRIDPLDDGPRDAQQYVSRLAEWRAVAKYPNMISSVHLLQPAEGGSALRLDATQKFFQGEDWPANLEPLRTDLRARTSAVLAAITNATLANSDKDAAKQGLEQAYILSGMGNVAGGWWFDPNLPALFHPILFSRNGSPLAANSIEWIAIVFDPREIQNRILPELSATYFQGTDGLDYQVAVVDQNVPGHLLYTSDKGFGDPEPPDADGIIDIFGRKRDRSSSSPVHVFYMPSQDKGPSPLVRISWFPLLHSAPEAQDWFVVVRHRRGGPLGAFTEEVRRRDLAVGFGVLLVLVINMGMLIATSHRAQRLAELQMTFITAVSHELRTPLTVILSGAENICNGVVETKQQMLQYGALMGNQARQLISLVERILLFAATRQDRQTYTIQPISVTEAIDSALADAQRLIEASGFTVERHIEPNLPNVLADSTALAQSLQNLITNALKYGADEHWLGVRASLSKDSAKPEVQITISDRGIGISPQDLHHIFEPFFRSPSVRAAQIHGTGLGLALSKTLAEAMNGRLTVESTLGKGSAFTLHLPSA